MASSTEIAKRYFEALNAHDQDIEQARHSIRKLAALGPSAVWPGHANAVSGDVHPQLEQAAAAPA